MKYFFCFTDEPSIAVIVGGFKNTHALKTVEVIGEMRCSLPQLPHGINSQPAVIITNDRKILICGGQRDNYNKISECLVLTEEKWVFHSNLNQKRAFPASITMPDGVYILGSATELSGYDIHGTSTEFLPTGSEKWLNGPQIPSPAFSRGCVVKRSDFEMILIGGMNSDTGFCEGI